VEVRLLTLPAPVPDDGDDGLDADDREAARVAVAAEDAERENEPDDYTRLHAALAEGHASLDATAPPVGQAAPVEPPRERTAAEWIASHNHEAAPAPKGPGPSSRCAVCDARFGWHIDSEKGHPFTPKPRGRPRAHLAAAQAADPDVEELPTPAEQKAILAEMRERVAVFSIPMGAAAEPTSPPCVDCGEEPGSCPDGRCRDCDIEHLMSAGSCRECLTWIMREEMAGPREKQHSIGCSLTAEPCYPRNAAEYIATRKARYGWTPPPGWTFTGWAADAAAEPETSRGGSEDRNDASTTDDARQRERERLPGPSPRVDGQPGVSGEAADQAPPMARTPRSKRTAAPVHRVDVNGCRPPLCHADDIHDPARVRAFQRPLCETHRRWVEGAGGTLVAAADMAAMREAETV
jgi:hypothetical protein